MDIYFYVICLVLAGIASASISFTIAMSAIFSSFREWVEEKSEFFGDLVQCPYCLGHYIAFVLNALVFRFMHIQNVDSNTVDKVILLIFTWFVVVGVMAIAHKPILTAYDPVMKIKAQKKLDKLKKKNLEEQKNSN